MKTITMPYAEHEEMKNEIKRLEQELIKYKRAVETVYGSEQANKLLAAASDIEEHRNGIHIRELVRRGKI